MYINNRIPALIFRVLLFAGCAYGLATVSGVFQGGVTPKMLAYYTNISNIIILAYIFLSVIHTAIGLGIKGKKGTSTLLPRFKGAVIMMLAATFLVYHFVLAPRLFRMSVNYDVYGLPDILIHYFTPLMAILDWLLFDKKGKYRLFEPLLWLLIPAVYFIAILIRAEIGPPLNNLGVRYPYFFIDADLLGWPAVLKNSVLCVLGFGLVGYIFYFIDKIPALRHKSSVKRQNIEM